tara:strand:- start:60 stop:338 length:279 start_codon:yes stop_codon:yes gene_type:complete
MELSINTNMAYDKKIMITKDDPKGTLPENTEWVNYKNSLISSGKLIKWEVSSFDAKGNATIDIRVDNEETWNDIWTTSAKIRDKQGVTVTKY